MSIFQFNNIINEYIFISALYGPNIKPRLQDRAHYAISVADRI